MLRRRESLFVAMAGGGIGHAGQWFVEEDIADAAVLVDAGPDGRHPSGGELVGQIRIRQELAAHGHEIGGTIGEGAFGHVGLEPPDGDYGHGHPGLDHGGIGEQQAGLVRGVSRGHPEGRAGIGGCAHVDGLAAGAHGEVGHRYQVIGRLTPVAIALEGVESAPDGEIVAHLLTDGTEDLGE